MAQRRRFETPRYRIVGAEPSAPDDEEWEDMKPYESFTRKCRLFDSTHSIMITLVPYVGEDVDGLMHDFCVGTL